MISKSAGFLDSPDVEFISGGVSAKGLEEVAIGRHGNFLHWGFSASPEEMTEEAKSVFANAIVYISQFAGQTPIARKFNPFIVTGEHLKQSILPGYSCCVRRAGFYIKKDRERRIDLWRVFKEYVPGIVFFIWYG